MVTSCQVFKLHLAKVLDHNTVQVYILLTLCITLEGLNRKLTQKVLQFNTSVFTVYSCFGPCSRIKISLYVIV